MSIPHEGLSGEPTDHYSAWRGRKPYLYWLSQPTVVSKEADLAEGLVPTIQLIKSEITRGFVSSGGTTEQAVEPTGAVITPKQLAYSAIHKFSLMGRLPQPAEAAFWEGDVGSFNMTIRKSLPETGIEAINAAKLLRFPDGKRVRAREIPRHFILDALIEDSSGAIENATHDKKVWFARSLMAKNGASNVNTALYTHAKSGQIELKGIIRNTLEGGHPYFPRDMLDELGYREWVSASMRPNKIDMDEYEGYEIPYDYWVASGAVEGIRGSGRLFGQYGWLSNSVVVKNLVSGIGQGMRLNQASEFTQQGEGAFWSQDIQAVLEQFLPAGLDDLFLSSETGQMGAVKADLKPENVVPLAMIDKDTVGRLRIERIDSRKPSVEGGEFYEAKRKMLETHPIKVSLSDDRKGFVIDDNSSIAIAPTWAGGHLHREADIPQDSQTATHLYVDPKEHPTYGCGVDGSFEFTQEYFRRATELWEKSGRRLKVITVNRAGHGTDYIQFPVVNEVNPFNHSVPLEQVLNSGELRMAHDVVQIEDRIAPWAEVA